MTYLWQCLKYEIGDKVIVLQTDEEAIVVDLINDKMVT